MLHAKEINKHMFGAKQKSKTKKKKNKARSHSPHEKEVTHTKAMMTPSNLNGQVLKSMYQNETKPKRNKQSKVHDTGRNKKIQSGSIEDENRPLKMKSLNTIKEKSSKKIKTKCKPSVNAKKTKSKSKIPNSAVVKELKEKMETAKSMMNEIYNRAASTIQRWFTSVMEQRRRKQSQLDKLDMDKYSSNFNTSPHNKDIKYLESSSSHGVVEKKVIIDIHTDNKDENYQQHKLRKRSKHNFSFGNDAKHDETPEEEEKGCNSRDTDFERYKRKKREDREYQFKKKGRNIFDSDKGEEAEEAFDYYNERSYSKHLSYMSCEYSDKEDRFRLYDSSKYNGEDRSSNSKKYIIDEISDNAEDHESYEHDYENKSDHRDHSSDIENNFMENYNKHTDGNEEEKHILISDKYSIEIENTDSKVQLRKLKEENNITQSENLSLSSKNNENVRGDWIDEENYHLDSLKRVNSYENNNLDLISVRSNSSYNKKIQHKRILDIPRDDLNKVALFSDMSKDLEQNSFLTLHHTLDVASLTKLRRLLGSEAVIRDFRTSENHSDSELQARYFTNLNSGVLQDIHGEIAPEDLLNSDLLVNLDYKQPLNIEYDEDTGDNNMGDFMATSDLIDLFANEGANKGKDSSSFPSDDKDRTITLFDKNPFKDFTKSKIEEVLQEKDVDQLQEIRKFIIDYRASVERKLLTKLQDKEAPTILRAKRVDIEKWVDKELKDVDDDNESTNIRHKAIKTICDTNVHTERIFDLIHRLNNTESIFSSQHNQERVLERNTIEELLKTDSDSSPMFFPLKDNSENTPNKDESEPILIESSSKREDTDPASKTEEDMQISETTLELMNKDFDHILREHLGTVQIDTEESKETSEKDAESIVTFRPKSKSNRRISEPIEEPHSEIIQTEVSLVEKTRENHQNRQSPSKVESVNEKEKLFIAEEILSTLLREIQSNPFPARPIPHEETKLSIGEKYREKAVFHLNPVPIQLENSDSIENAGNNENTANEDSEASGDNANICRSFSLINR